MNIPSSIRSSVLLLIFTCFFIQPAISVPIVLNGGVHNVDNEVTADHHPAFIINTQGQASTLNVNPGTAANPLGGRIVQMTTRDSAQVNGDASNQPPFNTQNSAVTVSFPVGHAPFTMNLNHPLSALASLDHNPNLDHYSPAISLAGNSTLNVSSLILGDIQIAYNFGNNANNVVVNLNNGVINGKIYTTRVVGYYHSPVIGTVNVNTAYTTQGDMLGLQAINFNHLGDAHIYHHLFADNMTIQNGCTMHLNAGSITANQNFLNNGILNYLGGAISSPISGSGTLNLLTNFTPTHHISNQRIIVTAGQRLTLNPNITIQSAQPVELNAHATLRIMGGTLRSNINGDPTSILEIEGPFLATAGHQIQAGNILVNSLGHGGRITTSNTTPISGFNSFSIFQGGRADINGSITSFPGGIMTNHGHCSFRHANVNVASIQNMGTMELQNAIIHSSDGLHNNSQLILTGNNILTGNYVQSPGSVLTSNIINSGSFGALQVQGDAVVAPGSTLELAFAPNAHVQDNDVFPIISANSSQFADINVIAPGNRPFIFIKDYADNTLRIRARQSDYLQVAPRSPFAKAIAAALLQGQTPDKIQDPILREVVHELYKAPRESLDQLLQSLSPNVANEIFLNGLTPMRIAMQKSHHRLSVGRMNRHLLSLDDQSNKLGYMAGDIARDFMGGCASIGPVFFGNGMHQNNIDGVNGFKSGTEGFGILGDMAVNDYLQVGLGAMYSGSIVRTPQDGGKINITSAEGLAYAGGNFGPAFLDASFVAGQNWYRTRREISFTRRNFLVFAKHKGFQYSAKLIGGYNIPFCGFNLTPLGTLEYDHLHQGSYLERGILNRFNNTQNSHLSQAGVGLRFSFIDDCERYVPEIHALYIRDLNAPKLQVTSQFTTGGPAFTLLNTPKQSRSSVNVGVGITAIIGNLLVSGGYDYEAKKQFQSHSGTIRVRWLF